ncbi:hypothetical protein GBAR_LOCUS27945 [Geodia barretti]|uniref:Uncharacterized protein n=1 Tax=Geodia barretti TaxID=519541 RepID=A0AA35XB43_GEOBA|nr:hypothetical protein GBAR_LOCUS27945 [Geodia barretti]
MDDIPTRVELSFPGGGETPFSTPWNHHTRSHIGGHTFWDPGGIKPFPDHNEPLTVQTVVETGRVHATDEDQSRESSGAVGLNNKTNDAKEGPDSDQTCEEPVNKGSSTAASGDRAPNNKVHVAIGLQGAATEDAMPLTNSKEVTSLDSGVGVMPERMSLPITGDLSSYELGLRPVDCSETMEQLNRAEHVTGMLPFADVSTSHGLLCMGCSR